MFELLLKPFTARKKPYLMFLFAFLISSIAILLAHNVFPECSSVLIITFTIIPIIPLMVKLIEIEEQRFEHTKHITRIKNYSILKIYGYLFLGLVISFSLWYTFLPAERSEVFFDQQIKALYQEAPLQGKLLSNPEGLYGPCNETIIETFSEELDIKECVIHDFRRDGNQEYIISTNDSRMFIYETKTDTLHKKSSFMRSYYFNHNFRLLVLIFLTSFIFGAGAIFIIAWNASIIGVFIGEIAHRAISFISSPFPSIAGYFSTLPISLGSILLHGIPEILGFFIAAIAGGILSVVIVKHNFKDKRCVKIFIDSIILFAIATVLLFIAAAIEAL